MSNSHDENEILEAGSGKQGTQEERFEKVRTLVRSDSSKACVELASEVAALIRERQAENKNVVLGLATGSTPVPFYRELIRLHKEEGRTFSNVHTFNLDEYYGLTRDHPHGAYLLWLNSLYAEL